MTFGKDLQNSQRQWWPKAVSANSEQIALAEEQSGALQKSFKDLSLPNAETVDRGSIQTNVPSHELIRSLAIRLEESSQAQLLTRCVYP